MEYPNLARDQNRLQQTWERWLRSFELFVIGKGVTDVPLQQALLLHCAGEDVQYMYYTLQEGTGDTVYDKPRDALNKYFKGKINVPYERYCFRNMCQDEDNIEQFITRLRQQAKLCKFDNLDEQIRDQIIEKCKSHKLRTRLLEKGHQLTFEQLRTTAQTLEMSETQAKRMESPSVKTASPVLSVTSSQSRPQAGLVCYSKK